MNELEEGPGTAARSSLVFLTAAAVSAIALGCANAQLPALPVPQSNQAVTEGTPLPAAFIPSPSATPTGEPTTAASPTPPGPSPSATCTIPPPELKYRRWNVKVGADADASRVDLTPKATTLNALRLLKSPPSPRPQNNRLAPTELSVYRLNNVKLIDIKRAADRDYHLVLKDSNGWTMLAENPDPTCAPCSTASRFLTQTEAVRDYLNAHFTVTQTGTDPDVTVSLSGVGFWDTWSGAYGQAGNAIELHPILAICIGTNCTP
ncbi:MAG: hypothetical protein M3T49_06835 [Candidatus Eremiobacteraeota bacterium]|nr:hypothetical protein [Candidatus Eremiobacteraeota bacterium]